MLMFSAARNSIFVFGIGLLLLSVTLPVMLGVQEKQAPVGPTHKSLEAQHALSTLPRTVVELQPGDEKDSQKGCDNSPL